MCKIIHKLKKKEGVYMITIALREFKKLFRSIRSIIIIFLIFLVTLETAKLINKFPLVLQVLNLGDHAYSVGLMVLIVLASPLFVSILSHNVINEELKSRTIRFIATKTSRDNIILGKFLGTLLFWGICVFVALILIIPFAKEFYFRLFLHSIIYISYFLGLTILLSTTIPNPMLTTFINLILSIVMPILGLWSMGSDNIFLKLYSYITPYFFYSQDKEPYYYFVLLFTIIFLGLSLTIMRKRDL
jgi:ABC-2 type transport system permease protein